MKKFLRLAVFCFLVACCVGILCALPSFAYTEITEADYPDAFAFAIEKKTDFTEGSVKFLSTDGSSSQNESDLDWDSDVDWDVDSTAREYLEKLHKRLYCNVPFDAKADTINCLTDEQRATLFADAHAYENILKRYHTYVNDGDLADQYAATPIEQVIESYPEYICDKIDAKGSFYSSPGYIYECKSGKVFGRFDRRFAIVRTHVYFSYVDENEPDSSDPHWLENDFSVLLFLIDKRWVVCDVSEWNDPYSQKNRFSEETFRNIDWKQGTEEESAVPGQTSVNPGNDTEPEKPAFSALPWILGGVEALVILLLIGVLLLRKRKGAGSQTKSIDL